jgi:UDP-N-acetylmuramoyl-tripeptide--D-alanyl-D-alanine ligase
VNTFKPELLSLWANGRWNHLPEKPIFNFCFDTRELTEGALFIALKTDKRDGHDYISDAIKAGASCALVDHEVSHLNIPQLIVKDTLKAFQLIAHAHRSLFKGKVIAITGSAGKTSTKELLALLLGAKEGNTVLATQGNLNNHIGVPLTLTRINLSEHSYAVIEAGISGPNEMQSLAEMIKPDSALVTLVAPAHLSGLGNLEGVAKEKSKLLKTVRSGTAYFPETCLTFDAFKDLPGKICTIGSGSNSVELKIRHNNLTTEIVLLAKDLPLTPFCIKRVSDGMASNVALALLAARELGVSTETLNRRLKEWSAPSLRGEIIYNKQRLIYLDCYNANPASMLDAVQSFEHVSAEHSRRLFIIGCMEELGDKAAEYHSELGSSLKLKSSDSVILIGDYAKQIAGNLKEANVSINPSTDVIIQAIAQFEGAIFMKGSRRYALEKLIPDLITQQGTH